MSIEAGRCISERALVYPRPSALVATVEGNRFLAKYPGIIDQLHTWHSNVPIILLSEEDEERSPMWRLAGGGQAEVYVVPIASEQYVYKVRRPGAQALNREIRQIMELKEAVGARLLSEGRVRLPDLFFATEDILLRPMFLEHGLFLPRIRREYKKHKTLRQSILNNRKQQEILYGKNHC